MTIPSEFTSTGVLAAGTYDATFADMRSSILISGNGSPTWDSAWRKALLASAEILTKELWNVGVRDVFLDGSFVEDKDRPNDIDGYFDTELSMTGVDLKKFQTLVQDLNLISAHGLDLGPYQTCSGGRISQGAAADVGKIPRRTLSASSAVLGHQRSVRKRPNVSLSISAVSRFRSAKRHH